MLLYKYNNTNEYIGEVKANLDPLETELRGTYVYAIPANTTTIKPELKEGYALVFNKDNNAWDYVEDSRGLIVYNKKTGEPFTITELGSIPTNYVKEKPYILQQEKITKKVLVLQEYNKALHEPVIKEVLQLSVSDKPLIDEKLKQVSDNEPIASITDTQGNTDLIIKADLQEYSKLLYTTSLALAQKKKDLDKSIKQAKNKEALDKVNVSFNVTKEVNKLLKMTPEEVQVYFEERN